MSAFSTRLRRVAHQRRALSAWNRRTKAIIQVSSGPNGIFLRKMRDPVFWISDEPFVEVSRQTLDRGWVKEYR